MLNHFCSMPDCAAVFTTTEKITFSPVSEMNRGNGVALQVTKNNGLNIRLAADGPAIRFLGIRWRMTMAENSLFLADAWERTYGDAGWRNFDASRLMPWYFLQKTMDSVRCFGVKVRRSARGHALAGSPFRNPRRRAERPHAGCGDGSFLRKRG